LFWVRVPVAKPGVVVLSRPEPAVVDHEMFDAQLGGNRRKLLLVSSLTANSVTHQELKTTGCRQGGGCRGTISSNSR